MNRIRATGRLLKADLDCAQRHVQFILLVHVRSFILFSTVGPNVDILLLGSLSHSFLLSLFLSHTYSLTLSLFLPLTYSLAHSLSLSRHKHDKLCPPNNAEFLLTKFCSDSLFPCMKQENKGYPLKKGIYNLCACVGACVKIRRNEMHWGWS